MKLRMLLTKKTEFEIYDNLFKEFHDKTFILISHRKIDIKYV